MIIAKSHPDTNNSFYFLLFIIFALPIPLGANTPWAWSTFEIAIFALTAFIVFANWKNEKLGMGAYLSSVYLWIAFIVFCTLQLTPLPDFIVAILSPTSFDLYFSVSADSYYLSVDPSQSLVSFTKLLSFFCLFICVLSLVNTEKRVHILLLTIAAAGAFQGLYGTTEVLFRFNTSVVFGVPIEDVATGSFLYNNHFANFLIISLSAAVGLLVASLEKNDLGKIDHYEPSFLDGLIGNKAVIYIGIAIMIIGLIMSRSQMGITAFFVAIAVVGAAAIVLMKKRSKGLTILVISIFIINLFMVSAYFGLERVKDRMAETSDVQETHNEVIREAYPIISDYPLFGSGGGSFSSTFPSYQKLETSAHYNHLHNDYLQLVIEYGVIGCFILFSIFTFSIYKSMRAMHWRRNPIFKGSSFACLMVFLGMSLHMTVDFPLQAYANASYFIVFLALSMIINRLNNRRPIKSLKAT